MHTSTPMAAAYGGGGSLVALRVGVAAATRLASWPRRRSAQLKPPERGALLHCGDWRKVCAGRSGGEI